MEILNSYPVLIERNSYLAAIFFTLLLLSPGLAAIIFNKFYTSIDVVLILLIVTLSTIGFKYFEQDIPSGKLEYQIIISDDYSAKDLYENYEVIKTEGKIWYIRDKEKNNENVDNK